MNKNKKVLLILILILTLIGCATFGISRAENYLSQKEELVSEKETSVENDSNITTQAVCESDVTDAQQGTAKKNNSQNSTSSNISSTEAPSSHSQNPGYSVDESTSNKENQTTKIPDTYHCTITIDCSIVLSNMDNLKDGKELYVPSDGYILKDYSIRATEEDSVYSLLKRACSENGIPLNTGNSGFGIYVSGINNIEQKDCGNGSGWIYKINGKTPGHSAEKEKITHNSSIVWEYVTHP